MIKEEKCVEYYFDSKKYNQADILDAIKREEIGFEKEKSDIEIKLNEYGIYVVRVKFLDNKLSLVKVKLRHKNLIRQTYNGYETYNGKDKEYGKYTEKLKTYQPI